jgi:hypothetical protein
MTTWILTASYNDYDQHGAYFISAFKQKPDAIQISAVLGPQVTFEYCQHIANVGGRVNTEYTWYDLVEVALL